MEETINAQVETGSTPLLGSSVPIVEQRMHDSLTDNNDKQYLNIDAAAGISVVVAKCKNNAPTKSRKVATVMNASQHPCPNLHCSKVFTTPQYLQRHRLKCKASEIARTPPFICEICNRVLSSLRALEEHIRIHTNEKPYQCTVCEMTFRHFNAFNKHKDTHSNERPYKCEICGKDFKQKEYLKSHMLCHTKDRNFKCSTCSKSYRSRSDLNRHELIHSDKKPYKCTKCEMAFSDVSTRNRHIRRHEIKELKEKSRVPCQLCSYKCTDIEQLKSHLLRKHGATVSEREMLHIDVGAENSNQSFTTLDHAEMGTRNKSQNEQSVRVSNQYVIIAEESEFTLPQAELTAGSQPVILLPNTQTVLHHPQESLNQRTAELTSLVVKYSPDGTKMVRRLSIPDDASSDATVNASGNPSTCSSANKDNIDFVVCHDGENKRGSENFSSVQADENMHVEQEMEISETTPDVETIEVIVELEPDQTIVSAAQDNHTEAHQAVENYTQATDSSKNDISESLTDQEQSISLKVSHADSDAVVIGAQHPSQTKMAERIQQSFDSVYLTEPDFSSQEFYDWLSEFTNLCQMLAMPLSTAVFDKVINLEKSITEKLASPTDFIKEKSNYKSLMTIAKHLKDVLNSHLHHVMETLDGG